MYLYMYMHFGILANTSYFITDFNLSRLFQYCTIERQSTKFYTDNKVISNKYIVFFLIKHLSAIKEFYTQVSN